MDFIANLEFEPGCPLLFILDLLISVCLQYPKIAHKMMHHHESDPKNCEWKKNSRWLCSANSVQPKSSSCTTPITQGINPDRALSAAKRECLFQHFQMSLSPHIFSLAAKHFLIPVCPQLFKRKMKLHFVVCKSKSEHFCELFRTHIHGFWHHFLTTTTCPPSHTTALLYICVTFLKVPRGRDGMHCGAIKIEKRAGCSGTDKIHT